jgi:protein-tyrosine phosphatase
VPSRIAPDLYIGSDPTAASVAAGTFGAVFLLARERQHKGETWPGVQLHRVPIADLGADDPMTRATVSAAVNAAHEAAQLAAGGTRTLLACRDGMSRSAWVAALALMHGGVGADEAVERVRAARGAKALGNPKMVAVLKRFVAAQPSEGT